MPREEVRERLFARAHPAVFESVLKGLIDGRMIAGRDRLALASHKVTLSDADEAVRQRIDRAFRDAALRPPDVATLTAETGLSGDAVERALTLLQRQKVLIRVDALWFHATALDDLKRRVRSAKEASADAPVTVDVAWFKNRFDVSRKFAIPLLEYLDRERVTRRIGNARVVL
jgi:selenocysteine-specific elongation factor